MFGAPRAAGRRIRPQAWLALIVAAAVSACTGFSPGDFFSGAPQPSQAPSAIGTGRVKVAIVLPLSAGGNAGAVGQSMRNAAEMAVVEFNNPDIQLLVKDDAGNAQTAQQVAQQALDEGAEIILGPVFAQSVQTVGQVARARNMSVIAFSTDSNVAARGTYLLSFLPESDVSRIVDYAVSQGKRSFVALVPDNAYGSVVEAAFRQAVTRRGARIVALERYAPDRTRLQEAVRNVAQAAGGADALFAPGEGDAVPAVVQALAASGVDLRRLQLLGTGLWEDSRVFAEPSLQGGWYVGADPTSPNNFGAFAGRYRARYGHEPARTASLSYDAVALVAALVRTQGPRRFSADVLTNPSGFAGIDGVFRFRPDGTNQRGLAVLRVTPAGGQVVSPAPRAFGGSGT